ncbi:peptidase S10 [Gimibacter soli]|uniref:Peptidase S10 n=2 Tax=Gimibacter soli TaxID=3024400 RepID=A0AAF0BLJ7_9PROT|nr:peptidase S10 [Gimibacter soli]WCL53236.1 peptidase S10 [Gimibacter soli]
MKPMKYLTGLLVAALVMSGSAIADDKKETAAKPVGEPKVFETTHKGTFGGTAVSYKAVAGETYLKDENGEPTAAIFSTSYIRTDVKDSVSRPVFFVFNGGPGSASVWLHMGIYGPKRIIVPSDAKDDGAAPFTLVDNPDSILDQVDMVFIDPVGTGWSRAIGKGKSEDFWGVKEDAKSVAEFIRIWLQKNNRWNSPKYLSGESYGTTRAAALLNELQGSYTDIAINGVALISSILDFSWNSYDPGQTRAYIGYLPTMAATAWYHGLVSHEGRTLEGYVEEVRQFALGDYATALLQGNRLPKAKFNEIAEKVAAYTGLKLQYVKNANLRVHYYKYLKELRRDEGLTVGRLDGRYLGRDYEGTGEHIDNDPSFYGIDSAYNAGTMHYFQNDLKVDIERRFSVIGGVRNWKGLEYGGYDGGFVNVAQHVGQAQRENSDIKILVANGYYDFATPFFATENTFNDNGIDTAKVTFTYYESGHMMYAHEPSFQQLVKDVRDFIRK